eukprot:scaffold2909_cov78-Cylindrotheca_fusiformis.AAC.2
MNQVLSLQSALAILRISSWKQQAKANLSATIQKEDERHESEMKEINVQSDYLERPCLENCQQCKEVPQ